MLFQTSGVAEICTALSNAASALSSCPKIQISIAEADLQRGIIRLQRNRLLQFGRRLVVLVRFLVHAAQRGMRVVAQRIDLDRLVKRFGGVVVLAIGGVGPADAR